MIGTAPAHSTIDYLYDFGDSWEYRLTVTDVCGGIPGFYEMLDAIADPDHPDHADAKEWIHEYDPDVIDELPIKFALARITNRRNAGKGRLAEKSEA